MEEVLHPNIDNGGACAYELTTSPLVDDHNDGDEPMTLHPIFQSQEVSVYSGNAWYENDMNVSAHSESASPKSKLQLPDVPSAKWAFDMQPGAASDNPSSQEDTETDDSEIDNFLMGVDTRKHSRGQRRRHQRRDDLVQGSKPKKKQRRKTAKTPSKMTPEVEELYKAANEAYLNRDLFQAICLLEKVICKAPGLHDPFHLLGLIYETELHNYEKALDAYLICAHLIPHDFGLWRRVASMSSSLQKYPQAIYAYKKAIRIMSDAEDEDVLTAQNLALELADAYLALEKYHEATEWLELVHEQNDTDILLNYRLARCYTMQERPSDAVAILEKSVPVQVDPTFTLDDVKAYFSTQQLIPSSSATHLEHSKTLDVTSEFVLVKSNDALGATQLYHLKSVDMLSKAYVELSRFSSCRTLLMALIHNMDIFPIEHLVRLAVSNLNLELDAPTTRQGYEALIQLADIRPHVDLATRLGDAYMHASKPAEAMSLYIKAASSPSLQKTAVIWVKIARCQLLLNEVDPQSATESRSL